jgi:purine-cytosine permease-like protein
MNPILAFLQQAEPKPDFTWNYIILGILVVLAVVLGINVMKKRQKEF